MLKINQERRRHAIVAMWFVISGCVLMLLFEIYSIGIMQRINSYNLTLEDIQAFERFGLIAIGISVIYTISVILASVFFILWFRRAYFNLHVLVPPSHLRYTEGWAAGAWFVPILNLFGPYQIATDLVVKSEELLIKNGILEKAGATLKMIKGWWWGLWVGGSVVAQIASFYDDEYSNEGIGFSILSSVMFIVSGILAVAFIRGYGKYESLLLELKRESAISSVDNSDLLDSGI